MLYQGLQGRVHRMLQEIPWTRERANKDRALVKLLTNKKQWDGDLAAFRLSELVDIAKDFDSANRYWRLLLDDDHHPELRGRDYDTKQIVEERAQLSLGYESGYHENVKRLELIN